MKFRLLLPSAVIYGSCNTATFQPSAREQEPKEILGKQVPSDPESKLFTFEYALP